MRLKLYSRTLLAKVQRFAKITFVSSVVLKQQPNSYFSTFDLDMNVKVADDLTESVTA